jgi:hypothetical protein
MRRASPLSRSQNSLMPLPFQPIAGRSPWFPTRKSICGISFPYTTTVVAPVKPIRWSAQQGADCHSAHRTKALSTSRFLAVQVGQFTVLRPVARDPLWPFTRPDHIPRVLPVLVHALRCPSNDTWGIGTDQGCGAGSLRNPTVPQRPSAFGTPDTRWLWTTPLQCPASAAHHIELSLLTPD